MLQHLQGTATKAKHELIHSDILILDVVFCCYSPGPPRPIEDCAGPTEAGRRLGEMGRDGKDKIGAQRGAEQGKGVCRRGCIQQGWRAPDSVASMGCLCLSLLTPEPAKELKRTITEWDSSLSVRVLYPLASHLVPLSGYSMCMPIFGAGAHMGVGRRRIGLDPESRSPWLKPDPCHELTRCLP